MFAHCVYTFDDSLEETLRINHTFPIMIMFFPTFPATTPHLQALKCDFLSTAITVPLNLPTYRAEIAQK